VNASVTKSLTGSGWDPASDPCLAVWEMVHRLICALESAGVSSAAALVAKLGSRAETARELCYEYCTLCEREKRANEAMDYNALVQSWPGITRLAREAPAGAAPGTKDRSRRRSHHDSPITPG